MLLNQLPTLELAIVENLKFIDDISMLSVIVSDMYFHHRHSCRSSSKSLDDTLFQFAVVECPTDAVEKTLVFLLLRT